jgi:endo-1,4-beta-mannosidase
MGPGFARRAGATSTPRQSDGMARFLLGVNYWPRTRAMSMWSRFDAGEIDEDFARIAALGLDVVRFFLLWEDFQPAPDTISPVALERFERVLDCAAAHGLRAMPTLFCGHMSGVNWLPEWTLDAGSPSERFRTFTRGGESPYGIGDFYTGDLLEAQRLFARAAGERARDHSALFAWDLGNEFSNLREPRTPADAEHWSAALTHDLFESSNVGATGGLHGEDVTRDRNIRPSSIAMPWKFATMHGYSVYSEFSRDRTDPEVVPFLAELTAACARQRVLFSEFGNPTCPADHGAHEFGGVACLSEFEMAEYAWRVLDRLQQRGALGAFWWCWADYAPALAQTPPFDRAPHELTFGIVRGDGSEKPVAATLAAFAREHRVVTEAPAPIVDEDDYFAELPGSLSRAYREYVEAHNLSEEVS